jgi:hypothetical protein
MPKILNSQAKKALKGREVGDAYTLAFLEAIGHFDSLKALQDNNAKEKNKQDISVSYFHKNSGDKYPVLKSILDDKTEFVEDSVSLGAEPVRIEGSGS